tara:strand:- start:108 stop:521 length:414 start_codon:yes stop_codon:yes gene_type:complete
MALSTRTTKRLIRTFLLGQASVTSLVDDRIFGSHLQDSDAETTEFPLVVFALLSGHAAWDTAVQAQSVEIYAFSKRSADEASKIYDAVFGAIQHERLSVEGISVKALISEVQRPVDGYNSNVRAWFSRGRWKYSSSE